ncbi:GNAT family N-acetyltransferase [Neomegalonema sp.]|uniref:GNAT family N-acetyltransferase n=1 Tax=Neomegalonema sp. TaxID=2039713 RepID=UPI00262DBCAB|nr:GNAT family N-acetyltransferase [Neomegalonema sp.]MDD2867501.1 GNAT family N-acetyltransferase [Neomegalonema sp.]
MSFPARAPRPIPKIETERLILDAHQAGDLADHAAIWADPEAMRHVLGSVSDLQTSWFRILRHAGLWQVLGYGFWALREKATGRYVGDIGFQDARRPLDPPLEPAPEAGWVLAPWSHGRGYATEAMTAALGWLDAETAHRRSFCLIAPANLASLRVAERLGYRSSGATKLNGEVSAILWREKPDREA